MIHNPAPDELSAILSTEASQLRQRQGSDVTSGRIDT